MTWRYFPFPSRTNDDYVDPFGCNLSANIQFEALYLYYSQNKPSQFTTMLFCVTTLYRFCDNRIGYSYYICKLSFSTAYPFSVWIHTTELIHNRELVRPVSSWYWQDKKLHRFVSWLTRFFVLESTSSVSWWTTTATTGDSRSSNTAPRTTPRRRWRTWTISKCAKEDCWACAKALITAGIRDGF